MTAKIWERSPFEDKIAISWAATVPTISVATEGPEICLETDHAYLCVVSINFKKSVGMYMYLSCTSKVFD